jgi:hypothetical protein
MRIATRLIFAVVLVTALVGCRDRAAEKRIAELEARLSQLETNKPASSPSTPAVNPVDPNAVAAATETKPEGPLPVLAFEKLEHDFGTIKEGQKVNYTFKFKNNGEAPLIVQSVQPSCGCTTPGWTRDPVAVNASGEVKVEFDSNGKPGIQNKTITVNANTWPKQQVLRFKAMVTPKSDGSQGPTR